MTRMEWRPGMVLAMTLGCGFFAPSVAMPQDEAKKLIAVLQSEAKIFDKAKACQRLAVVGTREAVPVLASLLGNAELAHYARFALEPIPDASADEALREALAKLDGKLRIGVINSIGQRRDVKALDALSKLLGHADSGCAAAAGAAIGRIGTAEAARILSAAIGTTRAELKAPLGEAALVCAEALMAEGKDDGARSLCDAVRQADVPVHVQLAGLRGAIHARKAGGVRLLVESLTGSDYPRFALALKVAREMRNGEVTSALVATLGGLPPEKRALVIRALGDRADKSARPAVLSEAKSAPTPARIAAIHVLSSLGDASSLPVLLEAAIDSDAGVAEAALDTLAGLGGKEIDHVVVTTLEKSDGAMRTALMDVAGRRRLAAAVPVLLKAADADDEKVRAAAIRALGETASITDLPVFIARLASPKSPAEATAVGEALRAACRRLPDPGATSAKLEESLKSAAPAVKAQLLEVFIVVGGTPALKAVTASLKDGDDSVRDAAAKTLSEWRSEDAAVELLALSKATADVKDRARTFRAFNHIVRKLGFPREHRLALCKEALEASKDDGERREVIETLANIPTGETFAILLPILANPALKEDACAAAVRVAERAVRFHAAAVADAMKAVGQATGKEDLKAKAKKLFEQAGGES